GGLPQGGNHPSGRRPARVLLHDLRRIIIHARRGGQQAAPQRVEKPPRRGSLAEFRHPQMTESNENPSFSGPCASTMTLLMKFVPTIPTEIEAKISCSSFEKVASATFSTT